MRIGILGSGVVAQTLGTKLLALGHRVKLGTRDPHKLDEWFDRVGGRGTVGSLADAAAFGEMVFNCTAGMYSLEALQQAGADNLRGKILVDVANPLDFSAGMPPSLGISNTDSLGEQIQRAFPEARVVKTLNTVNANLMVNPAALKGPHTLFVSGNDPEAKAEVTRLLKDGLGWTSVIDLGDITTARGTEMLMPLWLRLFGVLQTPMFNYRIVR